MVTSYVPLRLRSNWSLLRGGSSVEEFLERAAKWNLPALALTDENLYGAVPFFETAARVGVKAILGATLEGKGQEAVLLVENEEGYSNLCRILSARDLETNFDLERTLERYAAGLILIVPKAAMAATLRDAFKGRLFVEVEPGRPPLRGDLPSVAAREVFFARPSGYEVHRLLTAFRLGKTLAATGVEDTAGPGACLASPGEMIRLFREAPTALRNTMEIAERCRFDLLSRKTVFPRIAGEDGPRLLRERTFSGAVSRYTRITEQVRLRIEKELKTIIDMGFADYFLVVEEIVRYARSLHTPTAGRGSGAGSLVAFLLGITNVDPLRFDLPFERFLNPGRRDYPDLDVDFCWRLRDDVIDFAFRRFGRDKVAMIATYSTFRDRQALRETGKALGLSNPVITTISKKLRRGISRDFFDTLPADAGVIERVLELSQRIKGFPRNLSVHCGGVVITPTPVSGYAPLLRAEKGVVITAFDKEGVERVGLVKLDLLGNRSLSTASEAVRWIRERRQKDLDPEGLPPRDERTFDLIRSGRTVGCGQLESPAMRHLLIQMKPERVLHIMQALALIRPGAAGLGMKEAFIGRKQGIEAVPAFPPPIERVLGEAFGVMVYEDDAMRMAMALAGFSPGEADLFRRTVTGKDRSGDGKALVVRFALACSKKGMSRDEIEDLLRQMAKFRDYSFCRAHAASYAWLAYACAFLKVHYPLEYWTAALNNNEGMYPRWVLVEEAKRSGVKFAPPCVNRSGLEFTLNDETIRSGLLGIASLSQGTAERILAERPFQSLEDMVARTRPGEGEVEHLIRCGAMDFAGLPRNRLLWKTMTAYRKMLSSRPVPLFSGREYSLVPIKEAAVPELPPWNAARIWRDEWEIMGFTCREHPLAAFRPSLQRSGVAMSTEVAKKPKGLLRVSGIVAAHRRVRTEKGDPMEFLTFDDEAGIFEVVLFPDLYRKARFLLDGPGPFLVEGVVEDRFGALAITARRIQGLGKGGTEAWQPVDHEVIG